MTRIVASLFLVGANIFFAPESASGVLTIDWVPVGNPGNAADTTIMSDGTSGYGSVAYSYRIAKHHVTNSQYAEFLNAKDPGGVNSLGMGSMAGGGIGGIDLNPAAANGTKYTPVSGRQNHPVINVSWYDAIRFANWLNNGQGAGDTETGAYTLGKLNPDSSSVTPAVTHNPGSKVWLPTENEWYKAAYYNPVTSSYFTYPTSSNRVPTASRPTALPNHANFSNALNDLTDVGAYSGTTSPYGAFDMGGNVMQWNEALINIAPDFSVRGMRGSPFGGGSNVMQSSARLGTGIPSGRGRSIGFRVVSP